MATHSEEDIELLGAKKLMLDALQDGGKQDSSPQVGSIQGSFSQKENVQDGGAL